MNDSDMAPLTKCLTCGAESDEDSSKIWPDPQFLPRSPLEDWDVDWKSNERPALDRSCVVCATIISVYFGAKRDYRFHLKRPKARLTYRIAPSGRYLLGIPVYTKPYEGIILFHPFANTPLGEQYEPCDKFIRNSGSPEAFELVRKWLDTCRKHHPKCSLTSEEGYHPTRLLDIGFDADHENPRVVLQSEVQEDAPFAALSYCWGDSEPLRTQKDSIESHMAVIPLEDLPATLEDAVAVVRALGLRYIWIDSLCIVQDDGADWERESAQMDNVYGNAELVLAAAAAFSACDGFLRDRGRSGSHVGCASLTLDAKADPIETKYRLVTKRPHAEDCHIDGRAWPFQERLLARRYLAYTEHEMRWECREDSLCEYAWAFPEQEPGAWRYDLANKLDEIATLSGLMDFWRDDVLPGYTSKELTVHSDKLVALSGVASRFQRKHGDTYLAGLWREDLIYGLLWRAEEGMPENFYAPSWSWTSVDTQIIEQHMRVVPSTSLADIVDASVALSTTNPFGPVSDGVIKLGGRMIEAKLHFHAGKSWRVELGTKSKGTHVQAVSLDMPLVAFPTSDQVTGRTVTSARRIFHTEGEPLGTALTSVVWLIPLVFEEERGCIRALVLGPSPTHPRCFERLGCVSLCTSDLEAFLAERDTLVLSLV
ncbi:hypothetical protein Hte_011302 [Hypoxylon texense]